MTILSSSLDTTNDLGLEPDVMRLPIESATRLSALPYFTIIVQ